MMKLYPVMINLAGQRVTVVGAGAVALRKTTDLLRCGARVVVIAPCIHKGFAALEENYGNQLEMTEREYRSGDSEGSVLVFSATDDDAVNRAVFEEARECSVLVNAADDPVHCSFFLPSTHREGDLIMSVSTGGASPALAARLRRALQKHIPENTDITLEALKKARMLLKNSPVFARLDSDRRGEVMKSIVNDDARLEKLRIAFEHDDLEACLSGFLDAD